MTPGATDLHAALDATWPSAATHVCGPFLLRQGDGGGKRVSAATLIQTVLPAPEEIARAEHAMRGMGQDALFMIRNAQAAPSDGALDSALDARGYKIADPTVFYCAPVDGVARVPRPMATFPVWPPLALQLALWDDAGIGAARQAVMRRVAGPKRAFMARHRNRAAGVAFGALDPETGIAMLHALEVVPDFRREGVARELVGAIAQWAADIGGTHFALAVTEANREARALYQRLGMAETGRYHYRHQQTADRKDP
ncbi:MAG: GNAT family N-acetyltransferase [Pararhodobacter sp.]|nr:GNAT family N-acetyltransferase [Pararhodobacter sp.]